ncbi:S-adenosyl-L-methionine-dependent methyltransferase [Ascobolus immersus RN42]|uniref:S-adenosyl-L-methionine-dependent methyltransferase n=1 Tax=Ascobolus immersus RN42 TaxID=1160509 RepID=A0A3N4HKB6_ASCIM|nr:S-adenosyl-L-methionine-dependent methyltransferase [Ascobolus immersus RN42]
MSSSAAAVEQPPKSPSPVAEQGPVQAELPTEAIEFDDDSNDSSYGDSVESDTTSITSSVYNYQYENGRRYHNFRQGKYTLPNDDQEQDRLDMYAHVWNMILDGALHKAPLENPQKVLDVGTGTGIWAIDFADMYPEAEVIGTDLSPIQPSWVPPNVKFEVDDCEDEWLWERNSFDYIHVRMINGAIKKWKPFFQNIYDHLKPGAWLELQEGCADSWHSEDSTYTPEGRFGTYARLVFEGSAKMGQPQIHVSEMASLMQEVGFVDVRHIKYRLPAGTWPKNKKQKELGRWANAVFEPSVEAYGLAIFTRVLGMSEKEAREICRGALEDLRDPKIHMIFYLEVVFGRKPE